MARLYPFHALRYNTDRVNMADVVTQPYDKISPEMQARYYDQSPYNLIRIVLGRHKPGDTDAANVYTRAADAYHAWRREGILREEPEAALYGYSQTYTVPGAPAGTTPEVRERKGFIALGHLYDYADHVVYRHEQTFPKHKSDRLALFKALRAYPEQIYMLYSDPTFTAEHLLFDQPDGQPRPSDLEVTDEYGVVHRVWKLADPVLIGKVLDSLQDKELIIADGHHRYETSVAYMHERAAQLGLEPATDVSLSESFADFSPRPPAPASEANPDAPPASGDQPGAMKQESQSATTSTALPTPPFPEAAMMMTFVNMDAPGITILPTHRVLFGLSEFNAVNFARNAERLFRVEELPAVTEDPTVHAQALLQRLAKTPGVAFIAVTHAGDFLLRPKPEAVAEATSTLSPRQRELDVVQLHKLALEGLFQLDEDTVRAGNHVRYLREAAEALQLVQDGMADVAFLIKPVTLEQMKDISLNLEVMPQKSTDFYPKLLSGLAMYALD